MSDLEDNVSLKARQMQQRQILAMMGISQWVQPNSPTMNMADIPLPNMALKAHIGTSVFNTDPVSIDSPTSSALRSEEELLDPYSNEHYSDVHPTASSQSPVVTNDDANHATEKTYYIDTMSEVSLLIEPLVTKVVSREDTQAIIEPFDLQGARYGNWVLLVNIKALNSDSQKLWQNIVQALSLSCETSSFPICEGMDTAELANASLAGYIFKLGRYEDSQVAALTVLPDGLNHPNLIKVPTLNDMLVDTHLKRQLWEKLSH